jgi:hypothetical protein
MLTCYLEMDLLFAADTPWNWDAERKFAQLSEENPNLVQAAKRGESIIDPETGSMGRHRRASYASVYGNGSMLEPKSSHQ